MRESHWKHFNILCFQGPQITCGLALSIGLLIVLSLVTNTGRMRFLPSFPIVTCCCLATSIEGGGGGGGEVAAALVALLLLETCDGFCALGGGLFFSLGSTVVCVLVKLLLTSSEVLVIFSVSFKSDMVVSGWSPPISCAILEDEAVFCDIAFSSSSSNCTGASGSVTALRL